VWMKAEVWLGEALVSVAQWTRPPFTPCFISTSRIHDGG
jgi:hypothetical protein